jgi:hypothetical protein
MKRRRRGAIIPAMWGDWGLTREGVRHRLGVWTGTDQVRVRKSVAARLEGDGREGGGGGARKRKWKVGECKEGIDGVDPGGVKRAGVKRVGHPTGARLGLEPTGRDGGEGGEGRRDEWAGRA